MLYNGKTVQIMAMSECPNHCAHCCIRYKGHIPFEQLDQMMDKYSKEYERVILNGTELMMDERYIALCDKYGQNFIYTNGNLLNVESRAMLKKHGISRLSISLHYGIQEQISEYSLKEISDKIRETLADGFKVRVLCTISRDNYKLIPDIAAYVYSLGVKSLKFINMIKEGRAEGEVFEGTFLSKTELEEFFDILDETRKKYDKKDFYITRNGAFGDDEKHKNNFECPAGKDWIVLTPNHKVYPCNGLIYDEHCIGHWNDEGIFIDKEFRHDCKECMTLIRQLEE